MFPRITTTRFQVIALVIMLAISITLVFSAFTTHQAMANPTVTELEGFYYKWKCMECLWPTQHCLPPNPYWKYCCQYICEGGVGCWPTGDCRYFCCVSNP